MEILNSYFDAVHEVKPPRFGDDRGFFSETFNAKTAEALGITGPFVQDNQSLSRTVGTVRGLHFQTDPSPQGKLVRVLRGAIVDVAVDIRPGSATFGQHCAVELRAEIGNQLWVPAGFAHGFCTIEPDTEVFYKVTDYWDPTAEGAIRWNDPELNIDWGIADGDASLSDKDKVAPLFAEWQAANESSN